MHVSGAEHVPFEEQTVEEFMRIELHFQASHSSPKYPELHEQTELGELHVPLPLHTVTLVYLDPHFQYSQLLPA